MKKFAALLLSVLMLLTAVSALADDAVYMRQLPQYTYSSDAVLSWESYSEVQLSAFSSYKFFTDYNPADPLFLCFPAPANALASDFDTDYVHFLDTDNAIQYTYQVQESASWEEFINTAADDSYIIMDGSEGAAAYLEPDRLRAHGMLATKEFGKSSKMVITIQLDSLSKKMPEATINEALTKAITDEVLRVKEQMHYETKAPFWSDGKFQGIKFLDTSDFSYMLKLTFPLQTVNYQDGSSKEVGFTVTELRYGTLRGVYNFGDGVYVQAEIKIDDNPYAIYKLEEKDVNAEKITTAAGNPAYIYMSNLNENGYSSYCYISYPLNRQDKYGRDQYLTIHMDGEGIRWNSKEDFLGDMDAFEASYEAMNPDEDPYVPTERPATETVTETPADNPAAPADGAWVCAECNTENTGKFCTECGAAKPAPAEWTCPNCEHVNSGKFCSECGTARPEN